MAAIAAIAGVGMMVCCSSSVASFMMMGDDDDDKKKTPLGPTGPTGPTGPSAPVVPKPTGLYSTTDGIRHQANNPDGEHLFYHRHTNSPWAKHYKFSCKTPAGEESEKVGPYGPVTMGDYQGPLLRMGAAGTKPCGETNKMRIYRNDTSDGIYEDLTDSMRNLAGDAAYGGVLPSFLDTHGIAAVRT